MIKMELKSICKCNERFSLKNLHTIMRFFWRNNCSLMHIEREINQMKGVCGEWWMYNAYRVLKSDIQWPITWEKLFHNSYVFTKIGRDMFIMGSESILKLVWSGCECFILLRFVIGMYMDLACYAMDQKKIRLSYYNGTMTWVLSTR